MYLTRFRVNTGRSDAQRLLSSPHRIASHRVASHRVASHRIALHRIALHCMVR
ncbi:hypothetical protein [Streptomyces sp. NPDC051662]|uniref:hypothetical protein n=1 Tax=Streptomyces sp. NPDC051662 TaxID=3154750 RepID=UPI00342BCCC7